MWCTKGAAAKVAVSAPNRRSKDRCPGPQLFCNIVLRESVTQRTQRRNACFDGAEDQNFDVENDTEDIFHPKIHDALRKYRLFFDRTRDGRFGSICAGQHVKNANGSQEGLPAADALTGWR
jgi:hypothetical protein